MLKSGIQRAVRWCAVAGVAAVALMILPPEATAQTCSAADQQVRSQYESESLRALVTGDLNKYQNLQQSLPHQLSSSCRQILNQMEPMRVKCTAQEKNAVLEHYQAVTEAGFSGDVMRIFAIMENLEATLSKACWDATNRPTDPRVQGACTAEELDHVASFAGPMRRATSRFLTGDLGSILQLSQQMYAPLSQHCTSVLQRVQQERQQAQNPARQYGSENVLDHGGGTLSVPGLGACTPSGCMAY
jgi:hypothetical protein